MWDITVTHIVVMGVASEVIPGMEFFEPWGQKGKIACGVTSKTAFVGFEMLPFCLKDWVCRGSKEDYPPQSCSSAQCYIFVNIVTWAVSRFPGVKKSLVKFQVNGTSHRCSYRTYSVGSDIFRIPDAKKSLEKFHVLYFRGRNPLSVCYLNKS